MRKMAILIVLGSLMVAGCASSDNSAGGISGVSPEQARRLNGERNPFETAADPPITAETHYAAGHLSETQGDYPRAIRQYGEALKLNPRHARSLYRTGICYSQMKKYDQAVGVWKRYIETTGDAAAFSNLGFCYELAGQIDHAESAYQQGIARDSRSVPCRTNYGLMLARLGRTAEATLQLQSVLSEAEVHYNLASVFEHQGRKQQARIEYRKALECDSTLEDARVRLSALGPE